MGREEMRRDGQGGRCGRREEEGKNTDVFAEHNRKKRQNRRSTQRRSRTTSTAKRVSGRWTLHLWYYFLSLPSSLFPRPFSLLPPLSSLLPLLSPSLPPSLLPLSSVDVFQVDETGSMGRWIAKVQQEIKNVIESIKKSPLCKDVRVGLVGYRYEEERRREERRGERINYEFQRSSASGPDGRGSYGAHKCYPFLLFSSYATSLSVSLHLPLLSLLSSSPRLLYINHFDFFHYFFLIYHIF